MARLLVLANLELAFEFPEGTVDADELARLTERRLLRLLRGLTREHSRVKGSLERLEFESFAYDSALESEPKGYYYNKHDKRAETP